MSDSPIIPPVLVTDDSWQRWNRVTRLNATGFLKNYAHLYKGRGENLVVPHGYVVIAHQGGAALHGEVAIIREETFLKNFKQGGNLYVRRRT